MLKKYLSFLLFITLFASASAAEGDTTRIESHQQTHWSWYGNYFDTVQFPETQEYRKIIMYYTLGCPSQGCSQWDYTTKIEVSDPMNDSTNRWVELTRIMTPYAGDKNNEWSHTWAFDVTDFEPLLRGERVIRAHYGGYQDGFTITVNFDFIEGVPPRNVLEVNTLYDGTFKYGFANDPIENYLTEKDIDYNANAVGAKFRLVASGHSFGGNENCAEFCPKWYRLEIDGFNIKQEDVWRDDCGSVTLEAQTGTWPYNRAGWCPGDITTPFETDISDYVSPNSSSSFNVDWENYDYQGGAGFDPQYIIEALIFQYEDWNHALDASLDRVIKPTSDDEYFNVNPICGNAEVVFSNQGAQEITEVVIEYYTEATERPVQKTWSGKLESGESVNVALPTNGKYLFAGRTQDVFHARIVSVNGVDDDYEGNDQITSKFRVPEEFPAEMVIDFRNNQGDAETSYYIENEAGEVVFERLPAPAGASYLDTVFLEPGCYNMKVVDSDCDGLNFFANNDGVGVIQMHDADPAKYFPALHRFENEFGCDAELSFTVGYTVGVQEKSDESVLMIYPNPSNQEVTLQWNQQDKPVKIEIVSITGQHVFQTSSFTLNQMTISDLPAGNYVALLSTETQVIAEKFVIIK